jgi:dTMP kinase
MKRGTLITFEGPEGSGKTTQSVLLCKFLKTHRFNVLHVLEPGKTKLGDIIRDILLNSKKIDIAPKTETLLYLAARAQLINEKIKPALKKGKIVVCDRFTDATLVYQGCGLGIDKKEIIRFNGFATENIVPDITFLMDLKTKEGLRRCNGTKGFKDRIERRSLVFHNKVRRGYLDLAKKDPKRIKMFSAQNENKENIQKHIRKIALNVIKRK